ACPRRAGATSAHGSRVAPTSSRNSEPATRNSELGGAMPSYHRLGQVPPKRHVQFRDPDGRLYADAVFGTQGFSGNYSILYHLRPPPHPGLPPRAGRIEPPGWGPPGPWGPGVPRPPPRRPPRLPLGGDPVDGRVPLLFNDDVVLSLAAPDRPQPFFYKNGTRD